MPHLADNKRARFDYDIKEEFEAGLMLAGWEVKTIRLGRAGLAGSRVIIRGGEAYLVGADIPPYQPRNLPADYEPNRSVKLLLTKAEIVTLTSAGKSKGLTIIPLSLYNKHGKIKLLFGLARGKKKYDKREKIKKRDTERHIARTLKGE